MMLKVIIIAASLAFQGASAESTQRAVVGGNHTSELFAMLGPYGGTGGTEFSDAFALGRPIIGIEIRAGRNLDSIRVLYGGVGPQPQPHGGSGGDYFYFTLNAAEGETIQRLTLRAGSVIDGIQFETTTGRNSPWYGGDSGDLYVVSFGLDGFKYIEGKAGRRVDQLIFIY